MAWIVKESATMQIERRAEPWVTDQMKATWRDTILPRYATSLGALMPVLHDVQHAYGWIPKQAMEEIAAFLEITPAEVLDTVSFYEEYHEHPTGKYVVAVCQSIACEVCGHQAILDHVREKLDIEPHETTDDGMFTLLALECLGSCDTAPVALINDDLHEGLTIETIDQLIDKLAKEG